MGGEGEPWSSDEVTVPHYFPSFSVLCPHPYRLGVPEGLLPS